MCQLAACPQRVEASATGLQEVGVSGLPLPTLLMAEEGFPGCLQILLGVPTEAVYAHGIAEVFGEKGQHVI